MRTAISGTVILLAIAVLIFFATHAGGERVLQAWSFIVSGANAVLRESFRAAPALASGLALAAVLPAITMLAEMLKPLTRSKDATRLYRPRRNDAFEADAPGDHGISRGSPFVEIENGRGQRCAIRRDMLRIGREDDNDIRIPSPFVHRYHAAIHREEQDAWHITDLTGVRSNGLIVNGKRCCEARLQDGDLIQLGPGKLRFRVGAG